MTRRTPNITIHRHPIDLGDDPGRARAARRGEITHLALGSIACPSEPADIEAAVARALARLDLDPLQWKIQDELVQPIQKVLGLARIQEWFRPCATVLSEAAIADANGDVYRPDRVVITPTDVDVIDFKVGRREDAHKEQVANYVGLLAAIFPGRKVRGYLVYVDEPAIAEVE